jgi:hypothetical protein
MDNTTTEVCVKLTLLLFETRFNVNLHFSSCKYFIIFQVAVLNSFKLIEKLLEELLKTNKVKVPVAGTLIEDIAIIAFHTFHVNKHIKIISYVCD